LTIDLSYLTYGYQNNCRNLPVKNNAYLILCKTSIPPPIQVKGAEENKINPWQANTKQPSLSYKFRHVKHINVNHNKKEAFAPAILNFLFVEIAVYLLCTILAAYFIQCFFTALGFVFFLASSLALVRVSRTFFY
jgi:hypothetical protein